MYRKVSVPTILITLLLFGCSSVAAEICKGAKIRKAQLNTYDQHLPLSQAEINAAISKHLPWGAPTCPKLLALREFVICYDVDHRIPLWAAYVLTAGDVVTAPRLDAFRTDPRLTDDENARCADYAGSGYDRGHSVPRDDMNRTSEVQADTFLLSNMSPQTPSLNRGMWRWLEQTVRTWAVKYQQVYVIMGPVFVGPHVNTVPSGRVATPTEFFKIVIRKDASGDLQTEAFLLVNAIHLPVPPGTMGVAGTRISAHQADVYLVKHAVSITTIEHLTGLDFLPDLAGSEPNLFQSVATALWPET